MVTATKPLSKTAQNTADIAQLRDQGNAILAAVQQMAAGSPPPPPAAPAAVQTVPQTLAIGGVAPVAVRVPVTATDKPGMKPKGIFSKAEDILEVVEDETTGQHIAILRIPINIASEQVSASGKNRILANISGTKDGFGIWGGIGIPMDHRTAGVLG